MKTDIKLNDIFNVEVTQEKIMPTVTPEPIVVEYKENKDKDFDLARDTLIKLIHKNESVLDELVHLAKNSEHPRTYEVVGQLVKTQSEVAKDLLDIHKQKKEIEKETIKNTLNQTNNILFNGSTTELMKLINGKNNDSK